MLLLKVPRSVVAALLLCAGLASAVAEEPAATPELSLEDLLKTDVSTVSRKTQRLFDSAAAVYVVTGEEILRSGVNSLPEALRMVPGVQVARLGNSRWAVSARGFNGRFANKLLVLVDGRSVYSPLFSGVLWETLDLPLEDIERIEVIRGPGAAMWGANAVNGVINIITRKARTTQGAMMVVGAGGEDTSLVNARWGAQVGDDTWYRVWARDLEREASSNERVVDDGSRSRRAGFRIDRTTGGSGRLTMSGDIMDVTAGDQWYRPDASQSPTPIASPPFFQLPSFVTSVQGPNHHSAGHLLARYETRTDGGAEVSVQGYLEHSHLDAPIFLAESRDTADMEFQHRKAFGAHDLMWGLGYRGSRDDIEGHALVSVAPESRSTSLWSAFVHDEFTLVPDRFRVLGGTRLEHDTYTGLQYEPNVRFTWTPTANETMWGALSRAVRTPSRAERDLSLDLETRPAGSAGNPSQLPLLVSVISPGANFGAETMESLDVGFRTQLRPALSLDLAAFYAHYHGLRGGSNPVIDCKFALGFGPCSNADPTFADPTRIPYLVRATNFTTNAMEARTHGFELAADWHAADWWRWQLAYAWLHIDADATGDPESAAQLEGSSPRHTVSLRSSMNPTANLQFDAWLRRVSDLPAIQIPAYTELDVRLGWKVSRHLELSLTGQNLLHRNHGEFVSDFVPAAPLLVQRTWFAKARFTF